ncbi:uncharacterized protein LOC120325892 [Styela clava]
MTRWARSKSGQKVEQGSKWEDIGSKHASNSNFAGHQSTKFRVGSQKSISNVQRNAVQKVAIKKNKRSENRRVKRHRRKIDGMVCFHCRMPGHGMADCPKLQQDNEQGTGICFKCGSTEHKSHTCTAKIQNGNEFAFAKCFICGEEGHLSKTCPDNPRGLYPNGGCCKLCGSVDHYKRDCPERRIKGEVNAYRLTGSVSGCDHNNKLEHVSVDDEITLYESDDELKNAQPIIKKPKIVKF